MILGSGKCCGCEKVTLLVGIEFLPLRAPVPGTGWGCVVCDLPSDGAIAVFCGVCCDARDRGAFLPTRFACVGSINTGGRVPVADLGPDLFYHDLSRHPAEDFGVRGQEQRS